MVPGPWAPWLGEGGAPGISAVGGRGVLSLLPSELPCTLGLHSATRVACPACGYSRTLLENWKYWTCDISLCCSPFGGLFGGGAARGEGRRC